MAEVEEKQFLNKDLTISKVLKETNKSNRFEETEPDLFFIKKAINKMIKYKLVGLLLLIKYQKCWKNCGT